MRQPSVVIRIAALAASAALLAPGAASAHPPEVASPGAEAPSAQRDLFREDIFGGTAGARSFLGAGSRSAILAPDEEGKAQHGGSLDHLPAKRENVEVISRLRLRMPDGRDVLPGQIADVGVFGRFAYLASFNAGDCDRGGVFVVDISDIENPRQVAFVAADTGSYVGEGVHVIRVETPAFRGDVLAFNQETCPGAPESGGIVLVDVSDPRNPQRLGAIGDRNAGAGIQPPTGTFHDVHSVFLWQSGARAFAVMSDDEDGDDIDIAEITDPRRPTLISERGLDDFPKAQAPLANGNTVFNHDMIVKEIDGVQTMLVSYWDAGYIKLDVNDPANPIYLADSDFANPDPLTGFTPPEGNGHQAEFSPDNRYFIGADEDFSPFRITRFEFTSGANAGAYEAGEFGFAKPIATLPDETLNGPTIYGGYGCDASAAIPAASTLGALDPGEERIVVLQRGPVNDPNNPESACRFDEKIQNAADAGYEGVVIPNHHNGAGAGSFPDAAFCGGGDPRSIHAVCMGHRALHLMFNRTPDYTVPYPPGDPGDVEPNVGDRGAEIVAQSRFDGWGATALYDTRTMQPVGAYAVAEALDERFASGFGDLSVHEVEFAPQGRLAYFAYYSAGFRVASYGPAGMREVGAYVDPAGSNLWGLEPYTDENGREVVVTSDRDSGLWVFRYTGDDRPPETAAPPAAARPAETQPAPPVTVPRRRVAPRRVTLRVRPKRDRRRPFRYVATGTMLLPAGMSRAQACYGRVEVRVKSGKRTLSARRTNLRRNCTFRSTVTFTLPARFRGRAKLRFLGQFMGNDLLQRRNARQVVVRRG